MFNWTNPYNNAYSVSKKEKKNKKPAWTFYLLYRNEYTIQSTLVSDKIEVVFNFFHSVAAING